MYHVKKDNLISELKNVSNAAVTADWWTSLIQDHYLIVTLHYVRQGRILGKVLKSKGVYEAQTGAAVAKEIDSILDEISVRDEVVAATVDNIIKVDVAVKLQIVEIGCLTHTLNLTALKIPKCNTISY